MKHTQRQRQPLHQSKNNVRSATKYVLESPAAKKTNFTGKKHTQENTESRITNKKYEIETLATKNTQPEQVLDHIITIQNQNRSDQLEQFRQSISSSASENKVSQNNDIKQESEQKVQSLLTIILNDPLLNDLDKILTKQAELQKTSKLMEEFPLRYSNLLQTEILFQKAQQQYKEYQAQMRLVIANIQLEKQELNDVNTYLKAELVKKAAEIEKHKKQKDTNLEEKDSLVREYEKKLTEKQNQNVIKINKVKEEKQRLVFYIEEIKEENESVKIENQRLVILLNEGNLKLEYEKIINLENKQKWEEQEKSLNRRLHQVEASLKAKINTSQKLEAELVHAKKTYQHQIWNKQCRIRQLEETIENDKDQFQSKQTQKYNQIQQVRLKLLEEIKLKNILEENIQKLTDNFEEEISQVYRQNTELKQTVESHKNSILDLEIKANQLLTQKQQKQLQFIVFKQNSKTIQQHQITKNIEQYQYKINEIQKQSDQKIQNLLDFMEKQKQTSKQNGSLNVILQKKVTEYEEQVQFLNIQFKKQLHKYTIMFQEKKDKIEELRLENKKIKQKYNVCVIEKQLKDQENSQFKQIIENKLLQQKLLHNKIIQLEQQIINKQKIQAKDKENKIKQMKILKMNEKQNKINRQTQINDNELQKSEKQLQKLKQKYINLIQQITLTKKQHSNQIAANQQIYEILKEENQEFRRILSELEYETKQERKMEVESNSKTHENELERKGLEMKQLEIERKQMEIGKKEEEMKELRCEKIKYLDIIQVLRRQLEQLQWSINERRQMEEQLYNELVNRQDA